MSEDLRQVIASAPMFGDLDAACVQILAEQSRLISWPPGLARFSGRVSEFNPNRPH